MTLLRVGVEAIRNEVSGRQLKPWQVWRHAGIAAWLVWSMRRTANTDEDRKALNRARRVLQRAGRVRI